MLRGMLAFLAVNSTYRGPVHAGQRHVPRLRAGDARRRRMMREARRRHRRPVRARARRSSRPTAASCACSAQVERILAERRRASTGVRARRRRRRSPRRWSCRTSTRRTTFTQAAGPRASCPTTSARRVDGDRPPGRVRPDALRARRPARVRRPVRGRSTTASCRRSMGMFGTPEEMQRDFEDCRRGERARRPRRVGVQIPSIFDPSLAPEGKHAGQRVRLLLPDRRRPTTSRCG